MFPEHHIGSLREGAELPLPNIFISFADEVRDNGAGLVDGWIGLTYHNVQAMQGLGDILRRSRKSKIFIDALQGLGDGWAIEIQNKTQTDCPESTPKYRTFTSIKSSDVTAEKIVQGIADSDDQLFRKGDAYLNGNPVLWDVTIFVVVKLTSTGTFDEDVKKSFDLFLTAINLR
jgi:hypothetical protein